MTWWYDISFVTYTVWQHVFFSSALLDPVLDAGKSRIEMQKRLHEIERVEYREDGRFNPNENIFSGTPFTQ